MARASTGGTAPAFAVLAPVNAEGLHVANYDHDVTLAKVLGRLQWLVSRGRRRMDPEGCLYCSMTAEGPLCLECVSLLERLAARLPKRIRTADPWVPDVRIGGE